MFNIQDCKSGHDDLKVHGKDSLNLHDQYLYVIRKDGHYDVIYKRDCVEFEIERLKDCDPYFI